MGYGKEVLKLKLMVVKYEAGIKGNLPTERAELMEARQLVSREDGNYEYSFSMFIPPDFPIVPTRLVIAQWKQYCPSGNCPYDSPVVAIRYAYGVLKITHKTGPGQTTLYETKEEVRNRWLDFKFQIRFSTGANGRLKAWLGAKQIVDYTGVNAYPEGDQAGFSKPGWFYFKMGLYRDLMAEPMTIYIDEYRKKALPGNAFYAYELPPLLTMSPVLNPPPSTTCAEEAESPTEVKRIFPILSSPTVRTSLPTFVVFGL
jgi:hypothetical protein